ncbi:MAG: malonyl CoA-acyl carrier protein transacylase, partial [Gammaproteobacteria bacterium]|nr:malonyl CoA-acyl carrier protein transacylase [Gammaproteobacteria bacterium]
AKAIQLKVRVSSHTPLHAEQAAEFAEVIREVPIADPRSPIVSNISSQLLDTAERLRTEFELQLRSPVYWAENVRAMSRQGVTTFVEVGPGHVLANMVRRVTDRSTAVA